MQPSSKANGTALQANGRRRPMPDRVVPAIPLPLSRPRPAKGQQASHRTSTSDARAGAADADQQHTQETLAVERTPPAANGVATAEEVQLVQPLGNGVEVLAGTPVSRGNAAVSIATEPTPEPVSSEAAKVATPRQPVTEPQTSSTSPSARKMSDKFDMRPLRTELPPAFIPSLSEQPTPRSAASSVQTGMLPPARGHPGQQSVGSIVFGGLDSSASSPAPPQSAGSVYQLSPYPPITNVPPSQFVPQNHAHHVSEPYTQRGANPGYGPPNGAWNMRQGYHAQPPWLQNHPHQSQFRYAPHEAFAPPDVRQTNGHYSRSRSASQASSAAPKPADDLQSPTGPESAANRVAYDPPRPHFAPAPPNFRHYHPGHHAQPQPMPQPDLNYSYENTQALRDHVLSRFATTDFADCHVHIAGDGEAEGHHFDSHKLILSRSSTLIDMIRHSESSAGPNGKTQMHISLHRRYHSLGAFLDSIRYLYGGPLLSLEHLRHLGGSDVHHNNEHRMEIALQHIATGAWLKLSAVASGGIDAAGSLIHWDTIPNLLAFALDGGLSSLWAVEDGSEDRASTSSSDDSLGRPEILGRPTYDPYSTQLLHRMIDFVVHLLPPNFYVDASAPQLASCPRLPSLPIGHESKTSRSDPRLSKIRFGEVPVADHQRPSMVTTTISSLLLSLPFALLKCILEHDLLAVKLGPDTVGSIMRQVVAEREVRRKRMLHARPAGRSEDPVDAPLLPNLFWEEEVEASGQHRVGLRLARRRKGIDTPPSSGAASDRSK
ncbi:hypothetical protein B0A50_01279 [Salinomyces thailandicus]|uniref:BTB domain-containing protein n=1 Tax=Salinomyces thailandicus TaxID=706561 RepID=A0A4U0U9L8_9PEZI|nr:hypothetical protein B0A50_01279 [Salinomyces thailandica]